MLQLNFDPFPFLQTKRLLLRSVEEKDVEQMFFLRSDPQVLQFLDREPAKNTEEALETIKKIMVLQNNNEALTWALALKDDPALVGTFCFWNIAKEHYRAEIGYVLHPALYGKGYMQEVLETVLEYGFTVLKFHSLEANVNPGNIRSIKLLERNGFVKEAHFKDHYFYNGRFIDSAVYSLLAP